MNPAVQNPNTSTGYCSSLYAESLAEFGTPMPLPQCGGWLLRRRIPGSDGADAMGCYPLFCCLRWPSLSLDLNALNRELVSVALVTDPYGGYEPDDLKRCFDVVAHFKDHYECLLGRPRDEFVTRHHRYYARKVLEDARVEVVETPLEHLEEWVGLYATLVKRHSLSGIKAFSRESFARQLAVPGLVMLRITAGAVCLGAHLWFIQNGVAYSHLMALSDAGYAANASYGLYWEAIDIFATSFQSKVTCLNFGAGAGLSAKGTDGLSQFKRGWSTGTRPAWFCGRILDPDRYHSLASKNDQTAAAAYFPLYRAGEFG